jgi:hypothetical protein
VDLMPSPLRLSSLLAFTLLTGCDLLDKPSWIETKRANEAEANFYQEETGENGRLYVIGKSATLQAFKSTGELPYSVSYIGKGPDGQTVVLEADAKDPALQARLRRAFEGKHDIDLN